MCAAIRRIAYLTLTAEWGRSAAQLCSWLYGSESHFKKARTEIEAGLGVGRNVIARYLEGSLPTGKIETALATQIERLMRKMLFHGKRPHALRFAQ